MDSCRTTLTGMSEDEARALSMLSIPQSLVELGVGQKLKSALLKLGGALPPGQPTLQAHTQQRIYLDSTSWNEPTESSPHLGIIHQAVAQDKLIGLGYQGSFDTQIELVIEPLGLVAKMNNWYLVGRVEGYLRVVKITDILEVKILENRFTRDEGFDLINFWAEWCKNTQKRRWVYKAQLSISPELLTKLHYYLGEAEKFSITSTDPAEDDDWFDITIQFESFARARECILNFGSAAEVLAPEALRLSVIDFARQILEFYQVQ